MQSVKLYVDICHALDIQMLTLREYNSIVRNIESKNTNLDCYIKENENEICQYIYEIYDTAISTLNIVKDDFSYSNKVGFKIMNYKKYESCEYVNVTIASVVVDILLKRLLNMILVN